MEAEQRRYFIAEYTAKTTRFEERGLFACFASDGSEPSHEELARAITNKRGWQTLALVFLEVRREEHRFARWLQERDAIPAGCLCPGRLGVLEATALDALCEKPQCIDCEQVLGK